MSFLFDALKEWHLAAQGGLSVGASTCPQVMPMKHMPHTLPLKPRQFIHRDDGVSLESLEAAIAPHSEEWNKKSATEQFSTAASNMNDEFVAQ